MKPSSCKQKGRLLQHYVRDKLLTAFPMLEPDDINSVSMGNQGEDIQLSPAARKLIPISIECKSKAAIAVYKDYKLAVSNKGNCEPVLIVKQNRDKPLAIVDLNYFINLLGKR